MSHPDFPGQPQRPQRESFGMEIGIALMSIIVAGVLLLIGGLIFNWAAKPTPTPVHDNNQDPTVSKYRRVGFEIGRDNENRIQVITTPNPLLVTNKDLALLTGLPDLIVLDLRETQISDEALTHLTDLPSLEQLYLGGSVRTDTEPTLFHARFTDAAIDPVVKLTTLKILSLAKTDIGDEAVQKLPALTNLEVLFLLGTQVTDDSVEALSQMKSLKELYLQETAVTPEGLAQLRAALPETEILPLDESDAGDGS
ncbi:hypothetical protein C5Y96_07195 [Blastopirellula marina]|uniref:Leucine-rich repeat domain-containing protein n=1 Tax=Blastopirellula marina TaxID=124 RepID=A0A2S8FY03_9BACT|nr:MULTISPECIES: hypothetical protein [Pirellulaceae]PQO36940.1 hypothetical protein C5Y96_07195 [Blastopirellula marina]RCS53655.1 hypothetical protein DTL36_07205 [Bremerella cremea]